MDETLLADLREKTEDGCPQCAADSEALDLEVDDEIEATNNALYVTFTGFCEMCSWTERGFANLYSELTVVD